MTRLIDELDQSDPQQAHAAGLLRAGSPMPESEISRERVLRALRRSEAKGGVGRFRPALVVGFLFAFVSSAGATWGVARWVSSADSPQKDSNSTPGLVESGPREEKRSAALKLEDTSVPSLGASVAPGPSGEDSQVDGGSQATDGDPDVATPPLPSHSSKPKAAAPPSNTKKSSTSAADLALLHQATQALRSSEDPEKAQQLLRQYEKSGGSSALDEEALALRIEAAMASGDRQAARLSRRYLARYPKGRYRSLAQRAIERFK